MTKHKKDKRKLKHLNKAISRFQNLDNFIKKLEEEGNEFAIRILEAKLKLEEKVKNLENET